MIKKYRLIKINFVLGLFLICLFFSNISSVEAQDPVYNAYVVVTAGWSDELTEKPIVPRGEIVELEIPITLEVRTGETFGAGILEGYSTSQALIDLYIIEHPSWCTATLNIDLLMTNISEREETSAKLYLHVDESAPAFTDGIIKLRVNVDNLGFIKGDTRDFDLVFKPGFFPIIKTDLPDLNTMEVAPSSEAVFPIEVENIGNAETWVMFEVYNVPEGWSAVVTDYVILSEEKGSKATAYLTIIPSRELGYHYDDAQITVKITPAFADDITNKGKPLYANFIVKNRGFSTSGMEVIVPIMLILIIIVAFVIFLVLRKHKTEKKM